MRSSLLVPYLVNWLPVNSCMRTILATHSPNCSIRTRNTKEYTRMDRLVKYSMRERYCHEKAVGVETELVIGSIGAIQLQERISVTSGADMVYRIQLGEMDPILYTGTLRNVTPLWTPAVSRFVTTWFNPLQS